MTKRLSSVATLLLCVALISGLSASQMLPVTFKQMKDNWADALVRAEVVDREADYFTFDYVDERGNTTESTNIYTRYELRLKDVIYGDSPGQTFDLYMAGGQVGNKGRTFTGSFEMEPGWDIVIHLEYESVNRIYLSAGSAQTVFIAQELGNDEVFISLADLPDTSVNDNALSNLRTDVGRDELIRHPDEPAALSYDTLTNIFRESKQ